MSESARRWESRFTHVTGRERLLHASGTMSFLPVYCVQRQHMLSLKRNIFLPPANEVWGKVIFSVACVKNSVHGGGTRAGTPPGQVHPPGRYTPPRQVHPLGRYTPLGRYPPWAGTPPGQLHPPREQCMLGDTGNKRAVRILLECILVCR